jgi:uncharacterized protein (UPF0335 family)
MVTVKKALEALGYNELKIKAIVQIFHILGVFENKFNGSLINTQLSEHDLEKKLNSNFASSNINEIQQKFNNLGQAAFNVLRGDGERQQMQDISSNDELQIFFTMLNNVQEIKPDINADIYAVYGASEAGIKNRLVFLKQNVPDFKNKTIYILTGDRKLWPLYTGDNEVIKKKNIAGEVLTLDLIKQTNPLCEITAIENDINKIFEEYKNKDFDVNSVRKKICYDIEQKYNIKWPNEADLSDKLAHEIFPDKEIKICNGGIDPKTIKNINRPTTETTLKAFRDMTRMDQLSGCNFCFVSSQPYCKRHVELAKQEFGSNITGCGKAANSARPSIVFESLLGEIDSLIKCKSMRKESDFWQNFIKSLSNVVSLGRR